MELNCKTASILLALVIAARAVSFMFNKICLTTMNAFSLISMRFILASLILLILFHKHIFSRYNEKDMLKGFLFGTLYFCTLLCEHMGLKTTASGTASLIESMAIIIVPLAEAILSRKSPSNKVLLRSLISVCGIALLTLKGQSVSFSSGERYLLCAALFYASAIIVTNRLTADGDPFNMGFFQVCTIALLGTVSASLSGRYTLPVSVWQYVMIFLLAVVCTCFGFTLQPVAQSKVASDKAALFCAINPFVASILGVVFLHENFTIFTISGELMILAALILR